MLQLLLIAVSLSAASGCSRLVDARAGLPVTTARTMDWPTFIGQQAIVRPQGAMGRGVPEGSPFKPASWESDYGSVAISGRKWAQKSGFKNFYTGGDLDPMDDFVTEGTNEEGLSAHTLYLSVAKYGSDPEKESVSYFRVVTYLLDNCKNVQEAVASMKKVQVVSAGLGTSDGLVHHGTHFAVEDKSGESAVFEWLNGKLIVYESNGPRPLGKSTIAGSSWVDFSAEYAKTNVLTNDPPMELQLANLNRYKFFCPQVSENCPNSCERNFDTGASPPRYTERNCKAQGNWDDPNARNPVFAPGLPLPGDTENDHRFVRGSYALAYLPATTSAYEALANMKLAASEVQTPFDKPVNFGEFKYPSVWTIYIEHDNLTVWWEWGKNMNTISWSVSNMAALGYFNRHKNSMCRRFDVTRSDVHGDISESFERYACPSVQYADDASLMDVIQRKLLADNLGTVSLSEERNPYNYE